MIHTYSNIYIHYIFATKNHAKIIRKEIQPRLWSYIGGIARNNKMRALQVGGITDHVHLILSIPPTITIAKAIQLIKGNTSKWINEEKIITGGFAWQEGYGAFSVSYSQLDIVIRYIQNQAIHHRKFTFKEEYLKLLAKYKINYNDRYLWD
jgi:putative transposase